MCQLTQPQLDPVWKVPIANLEGGRLSFGTAWAIGSLDVAEVIDSAETIIGLPFARLRYVAAYKESSRRDKDLAHLTALERYRRETATSADDGRS